MRVAETFSSINGEGKRSGELAYFIRFQGCNLNCSYCDTRWANEKDCPYEDISPDKLAQLAMNTGIKNVTLTGGEPLLQENIKDLLSVLLGKENLRVEIETNGSVDISPFTDIDGKGLRPVFTMDYKLPASGQEKAMCHGNFDLLDKADTVKFVAGSMADLDRAASVIEDYKLQERCDVCISPVFGNIEPENIVKYMQENKMNDVRLQLQMHKFIWEPDKRGV